MRRHIHVRHAGVWVAGIVMMACGPRDRSGDDSSAAFRSPLDTIESPGALATRLEAQEWFDAASDAVSQKNFDAAAAALSDAVAFFRQQARSAEENARQPLAQVAEELDALARRVSQGDVREPGGLTRVFARAHGAESFVHLVRANAAMVRRENVRAGEELVMAVDHLERAARDARVQTDSTVAAAIANARSLATEMVQGMEAVPDEATRVTTEIEEAVHRVSAATDRGNPSKAKGSGIDPTACRIPPDCGPSS